MPVKAPKAAPKPKGRPKKAKTPPAPAVRKGSPLTAALRWSLHRAAREFGFQRQELETKRRQLALPIHPDHCYSTREICQMCFGDKRLADTQRSQAEAAAAIRRNQREEGELIPTAAVCSALDPLGIILRQKICASSMGENEKDEMLSDIEKAILGIDWEKVARDAAKK